MTLLKRMWKWLAASSSRAARKGHPDLYPLNVAALAQELNLVDEGRRLGEAGIPESDAKTLTGPEAAVVQKVEKARQDYIDWAVIRLNIHNRDLGRRRLTRETVDQALQAHKMFNRSADALLTGRESLVRRLRDSAVNQLAELAAFQARHSLARDARTPRHKLLTWGLLIFLIVVEGVLNASFFAQGVSTGLIGGFFYAVVPAGINVVVTFFSGKHLVCYIRRNQVRWKIAGVVSLLATLVFMTTMGLGIAHLRDSLTADAVEPAAAALQAMKDSPLRLRDIFSWLLFAVSVLGGGLALADGMTSDDPYPGYGPIYRRAQQAVDNHEDEIAALRADLERKKDDQLEVLDRIIAESRANVAALASLIDDKAATALRLSNALQDADNALDALLSLFRTANQLHRNGTPRPTCFDIRPKLRPVKVPDFDTTADKALLDEDRYTLKTLLGEIQGIRACIQEAFNQRFDVFEPLDAHFPRKERV
jgi:hypothetical protein